MKAIRTYAILVFSFKNCVAVSALVGGVRLVWRGTGRGGGAARHGLPNATYCSACAHSGGHVGSSLTFFIHLPRQCLLLAILVCYSVLFCVLLCCATRFAWYTSVVRFPWCFVPRSTTPQRPDVSFHVAASYPPQQGGGGGPPGGPPLRGIHHSHHGANPSMPPPHQQQPPPPSQSQHSGGPPGPAPTSTPPGPADMGKQGPPHIQGQPQIPQGQMQLSFGVNQPRPNQSQPYFPGPRGPSRLPNHRGQVVNIPTNTVGQQIYPPPHVPQLQQVPIYPSVVPQALNPTQQFFPAGQIGAPMFTTATRQNAGTSYFPGGASQPQLMIHQHQQLYQGFQSAPQGFFLQTSARIGGGSGVGGPGLAGNASQPVVVPGAPPQINQGPQVSFMPMGGSNVIVPGMTGDSGSPAGPVGGSAGTGKQTRRKYALDIIDPKTMKNVEIYEPSGGNTPPRSGDSSARETPQPNTGPGAMDLVADFAARVAKVASEESSAAPLAQPSYSESPSPGVPPQVVNVNGAEMNCIVTSSDGALSQSDASVSKSQIVDIVETTPSASSWKSQTQSLASNIGFKSSSGNKNKLEVSLNKGEDHGLESESAVKQQSLPLAVSSVSIKEVTTDINQQIPVIVGKEHQTMAHNVETSVPQQDLTPVVSALTNSPDVELNHNRPSRDQFPGLKSSGGSGNSISSVAHPSPLRRKKEPVSALTEKVTVSQPQSVTLVPNISVPSQMPPAPVAEMKPRELAVPPLGSHSVSESKQQATSPQQKKSSPAPETQVEEVTTYIAPPPKERRDRGREKALQNRELERSSQGREKSRGRDREKSSQGRSKGSPIPVVPSGAIPTLQPDVPTPPIRPSSKSASVSSATAPLEENKHQANGEALDTPEGKATQRPKHSKRGQQKMRDNRKGTEKEGPETESFSEPPAEEVAPAAIPSSPAPMTDNQVTTKNEESEADREEEKLVAARNEENAKVSAAALKDDVPIIENPPAKSPGVILKYAYKEDQWSPVNPDGKRKYERDFLMVLKNEPQSKKKPENLPDIEVVLKDNRQSRTLDMSRGPHDTFAPKFMNPSNARGGPPPKRNSQQGKAKGSKPAVIHVNLSLQEEVKLSQSENAWKPGRAKAISASEELAKDEELYKRVRGVLNKLTPQKFNTLVSQVQSLPIDNSARLQGVINLVFDKAIDEPSFSVGYAQMCKVLSNMQVPSEMKGKDEQQVVNFRKVLVDRCQFEFEKNSEAELNRDARFKELQNITDPEKKKELQLQYEEEERRMRRKSVGNIRFIGELFKLQMLTTNIMIRCIRQLLQDGDEESLECLCKLLTTIGKDLELKCQDLNPYFKKMKEISNRRGEVSSRVRFMLQDVIELREGNWVPRRDEPNPKTMEQIQREAEKESLDQQMALNATPSTLRRQDERGSGADRRKNRLTNDDGWAVATPRSKGGYSVDTTRLKQKVPEMDSISLGNRSVYMNWNNNSMNKSTESGRKTQPGTSNYYSALQDMSGDEKRFSQLLISSTRPGAQKTQSPLMEKERMLSPFKAQSEDIRTSSSSAQQSSRSSSRESSLRVDDNQRLIPSISSSEDIRKSPESSVPSEITLTPDQVKKKTLVLLDEYFNNSNEVETAQSVAETFGAANVGLFVAECLNSVLEKSSQSRQNVGKLMCHLIKDNMITKAQFLHAFMGIISEADDLSIDIPKICLYLAEIIVPLLSSETLSFTDFREVAKRVSKLVLEVLQLLVKDRGPTWIREKWEAAGISWSDFVEPDEVDAFIKQHKLEYTLGAVSSSQSSSTPLTMEEIQQKLVQFLKPEPGPGHSFDEVSDWIGANVGDRVREPQFIRALMTALCESAVVQKSAQLMSNVLIRNNKYFQKYVDNKEENELQCLYAVQAFVHRLEHPQGLLRNIFQLLCDNNFISFESFLAWEASDDPCEQVGKGVALMSLTSFFTTIHEGEDDSEDS